MPIDFTCPQCGCQNVAPNENAGHLAACGSCGSQMVLSISRGRKVWRIVKYQVMALICLGLAAACLLPAVVRPVEADLRYACRNNLKQIGVALHHYHDLYKTFPPANVTDASGKPTHSWRELLIPLLLDKSQVERDAFVPEGKSPEKQIAIRQAVEVYACPADAANSDASAFSNYVLLTGPGTVFEMGREPRIPHILDGTWNTILVVEVHGAGITWDAHRNLDIEAFVAMFGPDGTLQESSPHAGGLHVLFADGSVRFLVYSTDPATVRALATSAGGESVELDDRF